MSSPQPLIEPGVSNAISRAIQGHWMLFLVEGIILSLLGLAAITLPPLAGLATTLVLGWVFLIAGGMGLFSSIRSQQMPGFGWSLLSALIALIAGGFLLLAPLQGMISLTYLLIAFFIGDGIFTILFAIAHRRKLSGKWEWMLVNGIVDLFIAGVIIVGLPATLTWALGILVGIDFLFGGGALVGMALQGRKPAAS